MESLLIIALENYYREPGVFTKIQARRYCLSLPMRIAGLMPVEVGNIPTSRVQPRQSE